MKLLIKRFEYGNSIEGGRSYKVGRLYINGVYHSYCLERRHIEKGTYPLTKIHIHGRQHYDDGVCVGYDWVGNDKLDKCGEAFEKLRDLYLEAGCNGEDVEVEIE